MHVSKLGEVFSFGLHDVGWVLLNDAAVLIELPAGTELPLSKDSLYVAMRAP